MQKNFFILVSFLFMVLEASVIKAQTVNLTGTVYMEQDYRNVNFSSPNGNVKMILPGVTGGSGSGTVTLGGTVIAEPAGKTEKEKANNLKALQKLKLLVGEAVIPIVEGRHFFNFSTAANSTQPLKISCSAGAGPPAEIVLKNSKLPAPETTPIPAGQKTLITDQKIFLSGGNIPVYAANNTSTLFQPTDKFFVVDGAGKKMEAIKLASSPGQSVLAMPPGMQPGATTISRESAGRTDEVRIRVVTLSLSSPNTNLRRGETSSLMVTIDPKITDKDSAEAMQIPIMSIDLKNLTPGVIEMTGGNMQVMNFDVRSGTSTQNRTITGITPGGFNISATLYPSIANEGGFSYRSEKEALTTCEEFNAWVDAVKKDMEELVNKPATTDGERARKIIAQRVLDNLQYCNSLDGLDESKAEADLVLRYFNMLQGPWFPWWNHSGYAAYMAATDHLNDQPGERFVHTDVIREGLNTMKESPALKNEPISQQKINEALESCTAVDDNYSLSTLRQLAEAINKVKNDAAIMAFLKNALSKNTENKTRTERVTRVGMLDPFAKILYVVKEKQELVLNSFGASKQTDGRFLIHCSSLSNKKVTMTVNVIWATTKLLNNNPKKKDGGAAANNNDKKDSTDKYGRNTDNYEYQLETDLDFPYYGGDFSAEDPRTRHVMDSLRHLRDSLRNHINPEFARWHRDSTGTVYNIYIHAQCVKVTNAHTEFACAPNQKIENYSDSVRCFEEYDKNFERFPQNNRAGQFMKVELYDRFNCVGGDDICISKFIIIGLKYVYSDRECKKLIEVVQLQGLSCE